MPSTLKQFKARALARPEVKKAYDDLTDEFAFLDEVLKARTESGLTQAEVVARAGTTQSAIAPASSLRQAVIHRQLQRSSDMRKRWGIE